MCCKKVFTGYLYHRKNGIWLFNVQFWYFIETGWLGEGRPGRAGWDETDWDKVGRDELAGTRLTGTRLAGTRLAGASLEGPDRKPGWPESGDSRYSGKERGIQEVEGI